MLESADNYRVKRDGLYLNRDISRYIAGHILTAFHVKREAAETQLMVCARIIRLRSPLSFSFDFTL